MRHDGSERTADLECGVGMVDDQADHDGQAQGDDQDEADLDDVADPGNMLQRFPWDPEPVAGP